MNDAQKHALRFMFNALFEADEPEAMFASFKRITEIKARHIIKELNPDLELCGRWLKLAEILTKVEEEYLKSHSDYEI